MPLTRKQTKMFTEDGLSIHKLCSTTEGLQLWINNQGPVRRARNIYLANQEIEPTTTYYVTGFQAFRAAVLLAQQLFPDFDYNTNLCYQVEPSGKRFQHYDGEPVLIWCDYNSQRLSKKDSVSGFNEMFNPDNHSRGVDGTLVQKVNIILSDESFEEFVDTVVQTDVKRYKSNADDIRAQICRRIPFIVNVESDGYTMSKGNADGYSAQEKVALPDGWWVR